MPWFTHIRPEGAPPCNILAGDASLSTTTRVETQTGVVIVVLGGFNRINFDANYLEREHGVGNYVDKISLLT